jgi:tetratricopeptide (TPR) repeat protein
MNLNPTIGDAFDAFTSAVNEYENDSVITSESIETFNSAIQADVNFRDLLMGLPMHQSMDTCLGFVSYVLGQVDGKDRAPYFTIISAYYYELGDKKSAAKFLSDALNLNEEYSLAKLLSRVFASGWSPESLASMRNGLDAKVRATVEEQRETVISEINA